jgi:hypothetical protein
METRIRIEEYNDGGKTYSCQRNCKSTLYIAYMCFITILVISWWMSFLDALTFEKLTFTIAITFLLGMAYWRQGDWQTLQIPYTSEPATFNNLQDAEKFLDEYIEKEKEEEVKRNGRQVVSVWNTKYP